MMQWFPSSVRIYLLVALGGALGSVARFWCAEVFAERVVSQFPWATLLINIAGSFAIALFAGLFDAGENWLASPGGRAFFMAGVCGGFTTFSAFSLQTITLLRDRAWVLAGNYVAASVVLCLLAAGLGVWLATTINHARGVS